VGESITDTDEELVVRVQKGDTEAFGTLVERYEEKLLRYGRRFLSRSEDIEDIVQDVFMSAYQNIKGFDTRARFSPWIYRIAHNAFVNEFRKHKRTPVVFVDFDTLISHPVYDDPALHEREQKEMRVMIEKGLGEMEIKYREVLILYYLEDMSYKEISDILKVPTGTVGIRIKRAKSLLRKVYDKKGINYGN
jgi:RNA polymerase sigma-70 factor (ECF subfamily)